MDEPGGPCVATGALIEGYREQDRSCSVLTEAEGGAMCFEDGERGSKPRTVERFQKCLRQGDSRGMQTLTLTPPDSCQASGLQSSEMVNVCCVEPLGLWGLLQLQQEMYGGDGDGMSRAKQERKGPGKRREGRKSEKEK